jgi:CO/xanthine dehydrogenase Mo-binding subunit
MHAAWAGREGGVNRWIASEVDADLLRLPHAPPEGALGLASTHDGKVTGLRVYALADHGAFDACADPSKWPAGFFNIVTGSYDFPTAHVTVDGVYTNKAPGGVAYRCSFRVTEAAY